MDLKDVKIHIPEIPKEWTQRTRGGHTNIWNDPFYKSGLSEVRLDPPMRGLYAERFEDGWYWVCGCDKCNGHHDTYSYITCYEHDRCKTCLTHRENLAEPPWGGRGGFQCKPCANKEHSERKEKALLAAIDLRHSEDDCFYTSEIICPVCATVCSGDDFHETGEYKCEICDTKFNVEVEYETRYTSTLI